MFYSTDSTKQKALDTEWKEHRKECKENGTDPGRRFDFTMRRTRELFNEAPETEKAAVAEEMRKRKETKPVVTMDVRVR